MSAPINTDTTLQTFRNRPPRWRPLFLPRFLDKRSQNMRSAHISLNSVSVRVLYKFSSPVRGSRGAKLVNQQFLEHFVHKTNGFLMIFNFFTVWPQ